MYLLLLDYIMSLEKQFIYNILFAPNKILRLRYMLKGIIDGKKENMGKLKK